jgi:uncharacterized membrane protein (UPF0127 family)/CheY-like chemotaxis protein
LKIETPQRVEAESKLIVNLTRGTVACEQVEIADRPRRRMRGLLGREALPAGEGMLLQPAPSIHTAFMRFPLDVVFVDGTLRVVKLVESLSPWRIASARHAWGVLELATGEVQRREIELGDQLGVVEVNDRLGAFVASWQLNGRNHGVEHLDPRVAENGSKDRSPEADSKSSRTAAPPRVLLVGADRRFRCVAAALLTRRGYEVTLGDRTANLAELARRDGADVVVLDAGVSLTEAAHGAAQVESLDPPVGVVVVAEESERSLSAMPVLAKWGSFDQLYGAIEQVRAVRIGGSQNGGN